ncbi:Uncharacterised protein [Brevundimonas diminuta]|nr:Uncharacterised protein [Brevundimonas diminuta]
MERIPIAIVVTSETPVEPGVFALVISGPWCASDFRGVGKLFDIAPDDPRSGTLMVGADVASTNHGRPAGVVAVFQCSEDGVSAPSSEISAVLKSDPTRADLSDDADGFEEEARPLAVDALALGVGAADVLAGRRPNDDVGKSSKVGSQSIRRERADVVIDQDSGIVLGIEGAAPVDPFAGGHGFEPGTMQAERPTAGSGAEQVEDFHSPPPSCSPRARAMTEVALSRARPRCALSGSPLVSTSHSNASSRSGAAANRRA